MTDNLVRQSDVDLDQKLTSAEATERLAEMLRASAFEFEPDDLMTIATADELVVDDASAYTRGYDLLEELGALATRITDRYERFNRPLLTLTQIVRGLRGPQLAMIEPVKAKLARQLGTWKVQQDERDRLAAAALQEARDAAARARQLASVQTLTRIADSEPDPELQEAFREEAAQVAAAPVQGAPVHVTTTAPRVAGYAKSKWTCQFDDVKMLMKAWVEGRCHLNEADIIAGLQGAMDKQAAAHQGQLSAAYPGTRAVSSHSAVSVRRRT